MRWVASNAAGMEATFVSGAFPGGQRAEGGPAARAGFLLDLDRCVGCGACVVACRNENRLGPSLQWRRLAAFNPRRDPRWPTWHLSLACHHCRRAPCVRACPSGALRQRPDGLVWLDGQACLGCRYCEMACPFGAPAYAEDEGVMTKCHLCLPRLDGGHQPACVAACPTEALSSASAFAEVPPRFLPAASLPGFRDPAAADPSFWLALPRWGRRGEAALRWEEAGSSRPGAAGGGAPLELGPSPSPFHEVPLVVFSGLAVAGAGLGASPLVRWVFGGGEGGGLRGLWEGLSRVPALATGLALGLGLVVSLGHLGRPRRAWRALRGFGRSALSAEVAILAGAFLLSTGAALGSQGGPLGAVAALLAPPLCVMALLSLGWVYRFRHQHAWRGWAPWQPLVQGGLWGWVAWWLLSAVSAGGPSPSPAALSTVDTHPFWILLALDALVFFWRHKPWGEDGGVAAPVHPHLWAKGRAIRGVRVLFGTILPAVGGGLGWWGWVLAFLSVAVGVERFAFYALARRWTPEAELARLETVGVSLRVRRAP